MPESERTASPPGRSTAKGGTKVTGDEQVAAKRAKNKAAKAAAGNAQKL